MFYFFNFHKTVVENHLPNSPNLVTLLAAVKIGACFLQ
jgi:hypothetical protein